MFIGLVYFGLGLSAALSAASLFAPRLAPPGLRAVFALRAMLLSWAAAPWIVIDALIVAFGVALGHHHNPLARVGMALITVSLAALCLWLAMLSRARPVLDGRVVADDDHPLHLQGTEHGRGGHTWWPMVTFRTPAMARVAITRSVVYREVEGRSLKLDVYAPREASSQGLRPAVIYIHGGGWAAGYRRQSRFLHHDLAADGSVVFTVSYRLAPRSPFPAAIEDVKAAVAWVRAHAEEYGADGSTIVVVGSSAGAHLAAMVALSPNVPELQPGFESADTRVQGAVLLYGVYDFEAQAAAGGDAMIGWWLRWVVLRVPHATHAGRWRVASPVRWASREAPPVLVAHGAHDELVPPSESEGLVRELQRAGASRVHHLVAPLSLHAFEVFPSPMQQRALRIIAAFVRSAQGRAV